MKKITVLMILLMCCYISRAQQEIPLYSEKIPNSIKTSVKEKVSKDYSVYSKVSEPKLRMFLPPKEKANGAAVIVCPGGGYGVLVTKRPERVAKEFNRLGIAAFVLKYRLPSDETMKNKSIGPMQDAQQAIKVVRKRSEEWNIDPQKIGIMGFSAGGHLASTAGTHFDDEMIINKDKTSLRPDFMILVYPVISFTDSIYHKGSREHLLGKLPEEKQLSFFSNELHVTPSTPPSFITHADDDSSVLVANSLCFYEALKKNNVPVSLHIYSKGEHGYLKDPPFEEWFGRCIYWMKTSGYF
ncbi:alpha/beta hydrolase [Aurantibacter sp.]|uniref:alpha/beta hydrolase n=1 Tax=Aurantibacter sp. TaxID=2807103 RepID=UPI003263FF42